MNINTNSFRSFGYRNGSASELVSEVNPFRTNNETEIQNRYRTKQNVVTMKRMLTQNPKEQQKNPFTGNIVKDSLSYGDSIRASRAKAKDTALQIKKLKYDFKGISSQIMRSKTSASARMVAAKARREVLRLKNQRKSGEYDEEELQEAISHAQAMERIAKKKARHLEEEEMIRIANGPCIGDMEDRKKSAEEESDERLVDRITGEGFEDLHKDGYEDMNEDMPVEMGVGSILSEIDFDVEDVQSEEMQVALSELMEDMEQSMRELLEESGLFELADSMITTPEQEMDPADLKMLKIKHRTKEMKEIAKADAEYLKAVFERFEKLKSGGGIAVNLSSNGFEQTQAIPQTFGTGMEMPNVTVIAQPTVNIDISI